ncbi:MAG: glycosyltransferase family 87 protein [Proteobacteria bacterium]|nr:glycosyltransferase family 87 protein [Pseudomonadota bacterium]MDA1328647.1 glycosyltransferase family 87 protein [Pseudomonadota bacterium]
MRTVWVWLVWCMVSLGTVAGYLKIKNWGVFWDANVYKTALQNWQNGTSPYFTEDSLPYLYPPISLDLFDLITVDPRAVVIVFNCFGFILLTRALLGLSNGIQRPLSFGWSQRLLPFGVLGASGGAVWIALASGNIGFGFHSWIVALLLSSLERQRLQLLALCVISLACAFKPVFALYLIYFLWSRPLKNGIATFMIGAILCALPLVLDAFLRPQLFSEFVHALDARLASDDVGRGLLAFAQYPLGGLVVVLTGAILLTSVVHLVRKASPQHRTNPDLAIDAVTLISILICLNPRLKEYDLAVAVIAVCVVGRRLFSCMHPILLTTIVALSWVPDPGIFLSSILLTFVFYHYGKHHRYVDDHSPTV